MSPEERNYPVADKEMLSVIRSLEQWRHYLEGAHHEFEIWNDHANLQWFMKHQDLNRRQARWAQYLSRFNFKWLHKAGATMGKADALSRREDHSIGIERIIPESLSYHLIGFVVLQKFALQQMLTSSSTQSRISFMILKNQI
jgi:hypothetical protein